MKNSNRPSYSSFYLKFWCFWRRFFCLQHRRYLSQWQAATKKMKRIISMVLPCDDAPLNSPRSTSSEVTSSSILSSNRRRSARTAPSSSGEPLLYVDVVKKSKGMKICLALMRASPQKCSGMDHTVFTPLTCRTCLYLVSVHQAAPPLASSSSHLITTFYSFIDPQDDERLSWPS